MVVVEGRDDVGHGSDVDDDEEEVGSGTTIMADLNVKTAKKKKRPKVRPRKMRGHLLEGMAKKALHVLPGSIAD